MPRKNTYNNKKILPYFEDTPKLMESRKKDHIRICQTENVESEGEPFSNVHLLPEALPEMDFEDLNTEQQFLNHKFSWPLLITGMTGGVDKGQEINEAIAITAQKLNIPMGLGSQKMMIKEPKFKKLFDVRKAAPGVFLIGNLGAVSLNYGISIFDIEKLIDDLELNAFALHINALQECIQPEGERNFSNLLNKIEILSKKLPVPLIVKEVGSGISAATFKKLIQAGVSAVDLGGSGGTSWSAIEGLRSQGDGKKLGELFRNWGLRTDKALMYCNAAKVELNSNVQIIATGGIRNGLQVAKAVAVGASMVGIGLPIFKAAVSPQKGETAQEAVEKELNFFCKSLSISMFCTGAQSLAVLASRIAPKAF